MYLEYHDLLKKYKDSAKRYNEALEEKSKLILSVLPGSSKVKEVITTGGTNSTDGKIINYTSKIDEVDNLINQSRNTRDMLNYELKKLESKMRLSGDAYDKIYVYKWIEHKSVYKFYRLVGYSIRQTYRFIEEMKQVLYKK